VEARRFAVTLEVCAGGSFSYLEQSSQPERNRLCHHCHGSVPRALEIPEICSQKALTPARIKRPLQQQQGPVDTVVFDRVLSSTFAVSKDG
jgi:hypothetical protein